MIDEVLALKRLLAMSPAEVRSRKNAWEEVQQAGAALLAAIPLHVQVQSGPMTDAQLADVRSLIDAQRSGQADPLVRTVIVGTATIVIEPRTADMGAVVDAIRGSE